VDEHDLMRVLDGVVMTPAERAVIRERVEQMRIDLDTFTEAACEVGDARMAVTRWAQFAVGCEAVSEMISSKIKTKLVRDHSE
jgi:hypothetical protein